MADAAAHAPDEFNKWWETFNNGGDVEDEPTVDSDSDFEQGEQGAEEEENARVVAGEHDRKVEAADAHAPAGREGGGGAARDCDVAEEEISEDGHFQIEGVLQGMKREAAAGRNTPRATAAETQNGEGQDAEEYVSEDNYVGGEFQAKKRKATVTAGKLQTVRSGIQTINAHGGCLRAENQMLRLQLVRKTKELEAEQIRRLELELHFVKKENESLKSQLEEVKAEIEEVKAENEYYKKTAKPQKTRRLCRFCKEYGDHDYRNCPERRAPACSEEDDGSN